MTALSPPNVESELSYAYLHAVAAHAAMSCREGNRHEDNSGIDATLTAWGPFPSAYLTEVTLNIQLKATVKPPTDDGSHYSYFLQGVDRYRDLCSETIATPRILVVLFLPDDPEEWLKHSEEELALRRCAYWVSLRGGPAITTNSGTTIKIPKSQCFCLESLKGLVTRIAKRDIPAWGQP